MFMLIFAMMIRWNVLVIGQSHSAHSSLLLGGLVAGFVLLLLLPADVFIFIVGGEQWLLCLPHLSVPCEAQLSDAFVRLEKNDHRGGLRKIIDSLSSYSD